MQDYKKWIIWEKAHSLILNIYSATDTFPDREKYGLTSQLRRAALSIVLNLVEGAGKDSNKAKANFINIAYASAGEVEYLIFLCNDLQLLPETEYLALSEEIKVLKKMIYSFHKKIKERK